MKSLGAVKYGRNDDLERLADQLLSDSVRANNRSTARDIEKISYEHGFLSEDDLEHYDPANNWDTHDQPSVWLVDALDITYILPTSRRALMRHVQDEDDWGPTQEDIPLLGINEGPRKICSRCKRELGLILFYDAPRNKDGLSSWCKACVKESIKQKRNNSRSET